MGVCTALGDQSDPVAVSDGGGGIVIAWGDYRGADSDVYAQRLRPTGAVASGWTAGGKLLCGAVDEQVAPRICTDGAGGAIVAWSDYRSGADYDIYVMRVRSTGALGTGWAHNGELVCSATGSQEPFDLLADGSGGAVASWYDNRAGDGFTDIYVRKVTASGTVLWTANGVPICTAPNYQVSPSLGPDGSGGAYVAWQDRRHETTLYETELYLHHVLASGTPDPAWPANGGRASCGGSVRFAGNFSQPFVTLGSGDAFVFWAGEAGSGFEDVWALHITPTWTPLYCLQVAATPPAQGSVTKSPDQNSYAANSTVTLTAVPVYPRLFSGWSGDASGATNPLGVSMTGNATIIANFEFFVGVDETPLAFALEAIHSNPTPGPIRVAYTLARDASVRLGIYDLAGRQVCRLVDGATAAGRHTATWDGRAGGSPAASGIYFLRFETPLGVRAQRIVLMR